MTTELTAVSHSENVQRTDELLDAIRMIYKSMAADYGEKFLYQFRGTGLKPKDWADRIYKRLEGCEMKSVVDGYEKVIDGLNGLRMPTSDEIILAVRRIQRQKNEALWSSQEATELKFTGGIAGYVDALEKNNQGNPAAEREIKKMREILARPKPTTPQEQSERMAQAIEEHEKMIRMDKKIGRIKTPLLHSNPICSAPGCSKPGTVTSSTLGTDTWFCLKHSNVRG